VILSKTCNYGIQALFYVASCLHDVFVPISTISERLTFSLPFLLKVRRQFSNAVALMLYRGPKGGVALAKISDSITRYDMIEAIGGSGVFHKSVPGIPGCGLAKSCPAHDQFVEVRQRFASIAKSTFLSRVAHRSTQKAVRLANTDECKAHE